MLQAKDGNCVKRRVGMEIVSLIVVIVWGVIWGFATNSVISNKGYDSNWFWWGFFFGFIAFIVALTKPDVNYQKNQSQAYNYNSESPLSAAARQKKKI